MSQVETHFYTHEMIVATSFSFLVVFRLTIYTLLYVFLQRKTQELKIMSFCPLVDLIAQTGRKSRTYCNFQMSFIVTISWWHYFELTLVKNCDFAVEISMVFLTVSEI